MSLMINQEVCTLRIGVCFKIVPDFETLLEAEWEKPDQLDFTYVKKMYGCFDEAALETALRLADSCKAAGQPVETVAVTCGAPEGSVSESLLRALFAAGFDDVVLLPASESFVSRNTAKSLASYFTSHPADLIFTGRMVGPSDSGTVPAFLAAELNAEFYPEAVTAWWNPEDGGAEITCKDSGFLKRYAVSGGAVCSIGDGEAGYLRLFPLKARMEAKKRIFNQFEPAGVAVSEGMNPILCTEKTESVCRFLEYKSAEEAAAQLIGFLKGEAE